MTPKPCIEMQRMALKLQMQSSWITDPEICNVAKFKRNSSFIFPANSIGGLGYEWAGGCLAGDRDVALGVSMTGHRTLDGCWCVTA